MVVDYEGIEFDRPGPPRGWESPKRVGLCTVIIRFDPQEDFESYCTLQFRQSGGLNDSEILRSHHRFGCWIRRTESAGDLLVATRLVPNITVCKRRAVENGLAGKYRCPCDDF